jgi:predicted transcriptional regulator
MNKETAIKNAGSAKALSELLGVTQPAISQWKNELPQQRIWQLRVLKPEWFQIEQTEIVAK